MSTARSGRRGRAGSPTCRRSRTACRCRSRFRAAAVQTWRALIVEVYLELTEDTMVNAINVVD
jgi:hypothetical protein